MNSSGLAHTTGRGRYCVWVNGHERRVDQPQLAAVEIWALFDVDPSMELIVEGVGDCSDRLLEPDAVVDLDAGRTTHIFSRPKTNFG